MTQVSKTAGAAGSLDFTTKNQAGQLITPVSAPVVKWYTDAGRTLGELTLSVSGSGSSYSASWTAPQAPATPATRYLKFTLEVSAGVFDVDADDEISFVDAIVDLGGGLCTLVEAKTQLGKTSVANDQEILDWIAAVTAPIEDLIGPVIPAAVVEWHDPLGAVLALRQTPIVSVQAITLYQGSTAQSMTAAADPSAAGTYTYLVDPALTGIITRLGSGGVEMPFAGKVKVEYTRGLAAIPSEVNRAARLLVQYLWRSRNGGAGLPSLSDEPSPYDDNEISRAKTLLMSRRRLSGIA